MKQDCFSAFGPRLDNALHYIIIHYSESNLSFVKTKHFTLFLIVKVNLHRMIYLTFSMSYHILISDTVRTYSPLAHLTRYAIIILSRGQREFENRLGLQLCCSARARLLELFRNSAYLRDLK